MSESNPFNPSAGGPSNNGADDPSSAADTNTSSNLAPETVEWQNKAKEAEQKFLYLYADFENFKKRSFKERAETLKFGWEPVARELLLSVDNLERALKFTGDDTNSTATNSVKDLQNLRSGLTLCLNEMVNTLKKFGVEPINAVSQVFDPNIHEAIGHTASSLPNGTVAEVELKGYTLHGRLLRAARVVLSSGPAK